MNPQRITVLGMGLLGGSLCQALRERPNAPHVTGYAHREATLIRAKDMRLADELTDDLAKAVAGADLVVLCSPVTSFGELMKGIAPHLREGCVVTDVASTKRTPVRLAKELLPGRVYFVGSHPMAGGERSGAENAKPELFKDAVVIVTSDAATDAGALGVVTELWTGLGARVIEISAELHDHHVASISHLPHCTAGMLVMLQSPSALELSGPGYRDTTRVAAGDPDLWRDILLDNRDNVVACLKQLQSETADLMRHLQVADTDGGAALREYLASAAIKRGSPMRGERPPMV